MTLDHPLVRALTTCPFCAGPKGRGLVACWPCFSQYDMRNGNKGAEDHLDAIEDGFANQEVNSA